MNGSIFKGVFKTITKYVAENPVQVASILTGTVGTFGAIFGTGNAIAANNTNKKATAIYVEALSKNAKSEDEVKVVLEDLAEKQLSSAIMFKEFSDLIELIQQRPEGLFQGEDFDSLPKYNAEEFRTLSNKARIILDVFGGAALGATAGAAVVGFQAAVFGFSTLFAGTILFYKGASLRKKAEENYQRAEAIKQEVDSIVCFHKILMEAADQIAQSIDGILPQYESHVSKLKEIVSRSTDWNNYSELEVTILENSVLLARCLNRLCTIQLIRPIESNMFVVNSEEVIQLQEESQKILSIIDPFKAGNDNATAIDLSFPLKQKLSM